MAGRTRVLVVGAGLAGLAAAWRLARRGFDVAVCERSQRTGGRLASERVEEFSIDGAWPVISGADRELLAWIDEVGARDELLPLRPVLRAQLHRGRVREQTARGIAGALRTPGVPPHQALRLLRLPRLLARYAHHLDPERPGRAAPLDDRSMADFARLYFGRAALERWLAPQVTPFSLADPEQASRALFLRHYARESDPRPGLPRAPLSELPEAAARRLKVLLEADVLRIERPSRGGPLQVMLGSGERGRIHEAEAVVVATGALDAAALAAPVLVTAERDFLSGTRYTAALSLAVALRRALHPHPLQIAVPASEGLPLATVLFEPGVAGGRVPAGRGLALLCATGEWARRSGEAPDEVVSKELLDAFAALEPGATAAALFTRVLRTRLGRPRFDVGRYRQIERFEAVQGELRRQGRRIYFAGDYLVDPSWEGAVVSARRAADAVAEDLRPSVG